jgi:hypothetical protein
VEDRREFGGVDESCGRGGLMVRHEEYDALGDGVDVGGVESHGAPRQAAEQAVRANEFRRRHHCRGSKSGSKLYDSTACIMGGPASALGRIESWMWIYLRAFAG